MAGSNGSYVTTTASKVIIRTALYYVVLTVIGVIVWRYLPRRRLMATDTLSSLFARATQVVASKGKSVQETLDASTLAITVAAAMISAGLLALPVAWIYTLTRARRGYQQSVV